jgi:hypothetical protein
MSRLRSLSVAALPFVLALACSRTPEPKPDERAPAAPPATPASSAATAASSGAAHAGPHGATGAAQGTAAVAPDVAWDAPSAWASIPNPSPMRKATYKIPRAAGDDADAELTVSSAGGGLEANVDRWAKQFGGATPKTTPRTVNNLKVTVVEIKGTFSGGMPGMGGGAPKDKQMLLGAIVDAGETLHFFKMIGPEKTVAASRKDFDKLVSSLRGK